MTHGFAAGFSNELCASVRFNPRGLIMIVKAELVGRGCHRFLRRYF